jgi:hypothetical protein
MLAKLSVTTFINHSPKWMSELILLGDGGLPDYEAKQMKQICRRDDCHRCIRRISMQERDAVPSRCEADPDIQVMLNGPQDIVASLPLPHEGNPRAPRWPATPPEHMCNCRNGRGERQTASCPFKSLLAYAKRLLLRVPWRGSRRQHAEDSNNNQVDAEQDERGGDGRKAVPQGQPTHHLSERQNDHGEYEGDDCKDRAPPLTRSHRAQA